MITARGGTVSDQPSGEAHADKDLLELLGSMALELTEADELQETMQRVVDLAEQVLERSGRAGVGAL